jgi:hypothetical protein
VLDSQQPHDVSPWNLETTHAFLRIFVGCLAETAGFHLGILLSCLLIMTLLGKWRARQKGAPVSGIQAEFRYSLIPLTLLYSSLTKLFLLFLLTIWRPTATSTPPIPSSPPWPTNSYFQHALHLLDEDFLSREWLVRNGLGGLSAGFGLRVVLDIHPFFTSMIIFSGWFAKTLVATVVGRWVGGASEQAGEAWRAYSIP